MCDPVRLTEKDKDEKGVYKKTKEIERRRKTSKEVERDTIEVETN